MPVSNDEADSDLIRLRNEANTIATAFRSAYSEEERRTLIRRYVAAEQLYWQHTRDRLSKGHAH